MKLFSVFVIAILLLQAFLGNANIDERRNEIGIEHHGNDHHHHHHKRINCGYACTRRCKKASRKKICLRACKTCCNRCHCVPPGTYGNKSACPCYANLKTHHNKPKCP